MKLADFKDWLEAKEWFGGGCFCCMVGGNEVAPSFPLHP